MKKLLTVFLIAVLFLSFTAYAGDGAWEMRDSISPVPQEALDAFDKAMEGYDGISLIPEALLSTQLTENVNYLILCRASYVVPDPVPFWAYAVVSLDPDGNAAFLSIEAIAPGENEEEAPSRVPAEQYSFEADPGNDTYITDLIFDGPVTVTGAGMPVWFFNCEFMNDVVNLAPSATVVWISDDCEFAPGAHCAIRSGVREADVDYSIPKFGLMQPVEVECGDLGGVIAAGTFDIVLDGKTYAADDVMYCQTEDGAIVPYEAGMEITGHVAMHWWENGEEIVFTLGGN